MSEQEPIPQYTQTQIPPKVSLDDANKASVAPVAASSQPAPKGVRRVRKSVIMGVGAVASLALVGGLIFSLGEATQSATPQQLAAPTAGGNVPKEGEVRAPEQVTQVKDYHQKALADKGPEPVPVAVPVVGSLEELDAQLPASAGAQSSGTANPNAGPPGAPAPKGIWEQAAENYQRQQAQNFYQDKVSSRRAGLRVSLEQAPNMGAQAGMSSDETQLAAMQAQLDARKAMLAEQPNAYQPGLSVPGMAAQGAPGDGISQRERWQSERRAVGGIEPVAALDVSQAGVLRAGTLIEIVLETAINSELPGMLRARLVRPVEDAQNNVLLPAGTMFLGEYNARVESGSERVQLVWTRAVTPQGMSYLLGSIPGTDRSGASGSAADVDRHWGELVAGALVSTLLSGGQALAQGNTNALVQTPRQAFAQGVFASGQDTARQISKREVERSVVLRVAAGTHMAALVHADMLLEVAR
jgi:type IV secretion system protein TrbI